MQKLAGIALIVGSLLFLAGVALPVYVKFFSVPDQQTRIEFIRADVHRAVLDLSILVPQPGPKSRISSSQKPAPSTRHGRIPDRYGCREPHGRIRKRPPPSGRRTSKCR
jgi:hypothetical protein